MSECQFTRLRLRLAQEIKIVELPDHSGSRLEISIRPARVGDLKRILEIENASFTADAWGRGIFRGYLRECGNLFFVAKTGRRICGYVITCQKSMRAELVSVAVDPLYRGQGVGHELIQHTLPALRAGKIETWRLTARASNVTAIRFYFGLGFRRVRRIRRYYEDGEDGARMQLKL